VPGCPGVEPPAEPAEPAESPAESPAAWHDDLVPAEPTGEPITPEPVAFVLGGGGVLGAVQVGMLRALLEYGIRPDLIVGTSIGAVNGVLVAADPALDVTDRLARVWASAEARAVYGDSPPRQVARIMRRGTHLHSPEPLRALLRRELGAVTTFADLPVRFQCCAASIERAAEHWFDRGELVPAVLASSAVPALLPPMMVDGQHYIDGGIVNSIPVGRAVELGGGRIFVLQVGRIDRPLSAPRHMLDVAKVAFEISRRHRFAREMAAIPVGVEVHVLPTGGGSDRDDSPLAYRDVSAAARRIQRAYEASAAYLTDVLG
jgi:NTE family protein